MEKRKYPGSVLICKEPITGKASYETRRQGLDDAGKLLKGRFTEIILPAGKYAVFTNTHPDRYIFKDNLSGEIVREMSEFMYDFIISHYLNKDKKRIFWDPKIPKMPVHGKTPKKRSYARS